MPCNTPHETRKIDNPCYLAACLCAIFNCLERRNICKDVIAEGSLVGDVNIKKFYEQHKKEDEERMTKLVIGLSEDEKNILSKLLDPIVRAAS